jgi:hypothetical protein
VPRLFGRLWRSGARRAEVAEPTEETARARTEALDVYRRIEEARRRLREKIPPAQDTSPPEDPQT